MKRYDIHRHRQEGDALAPVASFGNNGATLALAKAWAEADLRGRPRFTPLPIAIIHPSVRNRPLSEKTNRALNEMIQQARREFA